MDTTARAVLQLQKLSTTFDRLASDPATVPPTVVQVHQAVDTLECLGLKAQADTLAAMFHPAQNMWFNGELFQSACKMTDAERVEVVKELGYLPDRPSDEQKTLLAGLWSRLAKHCDMVANDLVCQQPQAPVGEHYILNRNANGVLCWGSKPFKGRPQSAEALAILAENGPKMHWEVISKKMHPEFWEREKPPTRQTIGPVLSRLRKDARKSWGWTSEQLPAMDKNGFVVLNVQAKLNKSKPDCRPIAKPKKRQARYHREATPAVKNFHL